MDNFYRERWKVAMNVHCLKETRKMCSNIKYNCFTHHQTRPSLQRIVTRLQLIWSKINVCSNNLSRDYWSSLELVSEWSPGTGAWYEYLNRPIIGPGLSSLRIPGQHLQCHSTDFVWFNTLDYIDKAEHFVCPDYEIKHHSTPTYIPHYAKRYIFLFTFVLGHHYLTPQKGITGIVGRRSKTWTTFTTTSLINILLLSLTLAPLLHIGTSEGVLENLHLRGTATHLLFTVGNTNVCISPHTIGQQQLWSCCEFNSD